MSGLSEKIKTKQKVKTGTRLSKISEEIDTEMVADNAEDRTLDVTEVISEDKTDDTHRSIVPPPLCRSDYKKWHGLSEHPIHREYPCKI